MINDNVFTSIESMNMEMHTKIWLTSLYMFIKWTWLKAFILSISISYIHLPIQCTSHKQLKTQTSSRTRGDHSGHGKITMCSIQTRDDQCELAARRVLCLYFLYSPRARHSLGPLSEQVGTESPKRTFPAVPARQGRLPELPPSWQRVRERKAMESDTTGKKIGQQIPNTQGQPGRPNNLSFSWPCRDSVWLTSHVRVTIW